METSKEQMSKYLDKMQYLQRLCLGHSVEVEIHNLNGKVFIDFSAIWISCSDTDCKVFTVREWSSKEENDKTMKACVDFLTNELKWI